MKLVSRHQRVLVGTDDRMRVRMAGDIPCMQDALVGRWELRRVGRASRTGVQYAHGQGRGIVAGARRWRAYDVTREVQAVC